jgi:hypothetical protein
LARHAGGLLRLSDCQASNRRCATVRAGLEFD